MMDQFKTLCICNRHIENKHEESFRPTINFWQIYGSSNFESFGNHSPLWLASLYNQLFPKFMKYQFETLYICKGHILNVH